MQTQNSPREGHWAFPTSRDVRAQARNVFRERLADARHVLADAAAVAQNRTSRAVHDTETAVVRSPFRALAIAIGVGALIGVLAARVDWATRSRPSR